MSAGLQHHDLDQCSCGAAYLGCHPPVCRYYTLETPSELKEVQQGTGIFGIDHRSLPILWDIGRTNKARLAFH